MSKVGRKTKAAVFERDGYACHWCADPLTLETATVDHLIPRISGGSNARQNLVACCHDCNQRRGAMPVSRWQDVLKIYLNQPVFVSEAP